MNINEVKQNLILLQLHQSSQYGLELMNNIKKRTDGVLDLKQTQLYSLLKSMTAQRLITSYWEDSSIGGKRHYYKLTDLGHKAINLLPTYEEIVKDLTIKKYKNIVNVGNEIQTIDIKKEDWSKNKIDESTMYEINQQNAKIIADKIEVDHSEKTFLATTKKTPRTKIKIQNDEIIDKEIYNDIQPTITNIISPEYNMQQKISRNDFVDYSTDKKMIKNAALIKNILIKNIILFILQLALISTAIIINYNAGNAELLNTFAMCFVVLCVVKFVFFMVTIAKLKYKIVEEKYVFSHNNNILRNIIISCSIYLLYLFLLFVFFPSTIKITLAIVLLIAVLPIINLILNIIFIEQKLKN